MPAPIRLAWMIRRSPSAGVRNARGSTMTKSEPGVLAAADHRDLVMCAWILAQESNLKPVLADRTTVAHFEPQHLAVEGL
jgi:hypothetical protein